MPRSMLVAPQGFEPRYADPESAVLPLNEGAKQRQQNAAFENSFRSNNKWTIIWGQREWTSVSSSRLWKSAQGAAFSSQVESLQKSREPRQMARLPMLLTAP